MPHRYRFIDGVKGIALLLIVFYHAMPVGAAKEFLAIAMASSLCLFFFTSGYFFNQEKADFSSNMKKRAVRLLKPFLIYGIALWIIGSVYLLISGNETFLEAIYCLRNFFAGCIWNRSIQNVFALEYYSLGSRYPFLAVFWFLLTMFLASLLFFLVAKFIYRSKMKIVLIAVAFLVIGGLLAPLKDFLPYNLHTAVYFCAFMLFGLLCRQCGFPEKSLLPKSMQYLVGALAVAASIVLGYMKIFESGGGLFRGSFGDPEFISMIGITLSALLFIYGILRIFYRLENDRVRIAEICWIGKNSLEIFLLHNLIFFLINIATGFEIGWKDQADTLQTNIASVIGACVAVAVCCVFVKVKEKLVEAYKASSK